MLRRSHMGFNVRLYDPKPFPHINGVAIKLVLRRFSLKRAIKNIQRKYSTKRNPHHPYSFNQQKYSPQEIAPKTVVRLDYKFIV